MAVAVGSRTHMISTAATATTTTTTAAALHPSFPVLLHGIFPIKVCVAGSDGRRISLDGSGGSGTLHHKERERGGFRRGKNVCGVGVHTCTHIYPETKASTGYKD